MIKQFRRLICLLVALILILSSVSGVMALEQDDDVNVGDDSTSEQEDAIDISDATITLSKSTYTYSGKACKPTVSVTLDDIVLSKEDYKIAYKNNTNAGKATVTVTGLGNYTGTVSKKFTIKKAANTIVQENVCTSYSTKAQTVQLVKKAKYEKAALTYFSSDSDIKISSSGKVTIPKKWSGKVTITIKSKATTNYAAATLKIKILVPTNTTLSSVKKASATSIKVTWKKSSVATGYQVQYATDSEFSNKKTVTITKQTTLNKTIKSLKKGKTYYVRVRAYKTLDGTKYFGKWSTVKKISLPAGSTKPQSDTSSGTVYWVPNGSVYHKSKNCPSLKRSKTIYSGTVAESGKSRACKVCS